MPDQVKNIMIGLFVTVAAAIVIFMLMFLHPTIGDDGKTLMVRFTDIDKVSIGTRVTYAGKPAGEVLEIREVEHGREGKTDSSGRLYIYELILTVDSGVDVYNTDVVSLRTSGLLGEKNIEITPYAPEPGQQLRKIENEIIYAQETGSVEETFKEIKVVASKFDKALDAITDTLYRARDEQLIEKITRSVEHIQSITQALDKPQQWSETLANMHRLSQRVHETWTSVDNSIANFDNTLATFRKAADCACKFLDSGNVIIEGISTGKGTLGRLLVADDFYLRLTSVMSKLETVMDDINHYGLLFHSDKGWQRLRARRLNLLQQLQTPQEFRNYFNDEINQISTSLSRVSMVLDEVSNDPCCTDLMQNREFTKVFAELMRRVSMLEEEVRMYNTQVVDMQVHQTELGEGVPCCETDPCDTWQQNPCGSWQQDANGSWQWNPQ